MSKNEAIEFVQNNARYYDDGSFEPYSVCMRVSSFGQKIPMTW